MSDSACTKNIHAGGEVENGFLCAKETVAYFSACMDIFSRYSRDRMRQLAAITQDQVACISKEVEKGLGETDRCGAMPASVVPVMPDQCSALFALGKICAVVGHATPSHGVAWLRFACVRAWLARPRSRAMTSALPTGTPEKPATRSCFRCTKSRSL